MLKNLLLVVSILFFSSYSYAQDLVQVSIPMECRVFNQTGSQCVWASLEALARAHKIHAASRLTDTYKSESLPHPTSAVLQNLGVKHYMIHPGKQNRLFLQTACSNGWGAAVGLGMRHAVVVVHFKDGLVGLIDNSDPTLEVKIWTEEKFMKHWDGWALCLEPPSFRK